MEPTLQGFLDFHGETIKKQYDLYIESLKPHKDDIEKVNITEKSREDDIETITERIENVKITEKPKNKGRKCGICGEYGHNRRTCPTINSDKPEKKVKKKRSEKKKIEKVEFDYETFQKEIYNLKYGESMCELCHTDFTNNMLTNQNDKNICSSKNNIVINHLTVMIISWYN